MIDDLFRSVPTHLLNDSGRVFYSGRDAFSNPSQLYLLGLNPGGSPVKQARETVSSHSNCVLQELPTNWSAYSDESWEEAPAGTLPLQRRGRHLLRRLDLDPGDVPSSNLIFVRTAGEEGLKGRTRELAEACWAFHQHVITTLNIEVILCFGGTTGDWVCRKLGAVEHVDTFVEDNDRHWKSHAFRNASGIGVVIASHPGRADWTKTATDPTRLVEHLLTSSATADKRSC
jgi:hypothetical protein